jgi:hypothetical protein
MDYLKKKLEVRCVVRGAGTVNPCPKNRWFGLSVRVGGVLRLVVRGGRFLHIRARLQQHPRRLPIPRISPNVEVYTNDFSPSEAHIYIFILYLYLYLYYIYIYSSTRAAWPRPTH